MPAFKQTKKQREIMGIVFDYLETGVEPTAVQIAEKVSYNITVPAMHCSLRFLVGHGMLEKNDEKKWQPGEGSRFKPTLLGYKIFKPAASL